MLTAEEIDLLDSIIKPINEQIDADPILSEDEKRIFEYLDTSLMLKSYRNVYFYKILRISNCKTESFLLIAKVTYSISSGKYNLGASELQLIGLKKLDKNYANILIRPETVEDKVSEWFTKTEIDFKDFPKFSSDYYFLAEDEQLGYSFATVNRLSSIEDQRELFIEIAGDILVSKYPRKFNVEDFNTMLKFIEKV